MSNTHVTYVVAVGCGLFGLIAFFAFIAVPAVTSYRRVWERAVALVLSMYVLAALVGIGVALGALIVLEWPRFF